MELRRTVGHAFEVLRSLALLAPSDSQLLTWVLRAIEGRRGIGGVRLSSRQQTRTRLATYAVMDRLGATAATRALVAGVAVTANELVQDPSWVGIANELDATDCDLVHAARPQGQRFPLTCNAKLAECRQQAFLEAERPRLEAVLNEAANDPEFDDAKFLLVLQSVLLATPLRTLGQRRCWPLGDMILSLEALGIGAVLTSNRKHFAPICRALGLELVTYVP
jgi:hypothetical protein